MPSCLLGTLLSLHPELARGWTVPIPLTLSSLQHSITFWATQSPQGWSRTCWALAHPLHTSARQGSPVGSLSAEDALPAPSTGGIQPLETILCVRAQSPYVRLLPAQQCRDLEASCWCVGLTHLWTSALWLVTLCHGTNFSGGQRYLPPEKGVWAESLDTSEALGVRVDGTHLLFLCTLIFSESGLGLHLAECM